MFQPLFDMIGDRASTVYFVSFHTLHVYGYSGFSSRVAWRIYDGLGPPKRVVPHFLFSWLRYRILEYGGATGEGVDKAAEFRSQVVLGRASLLRCHFLGNLVLTSAR